MKDPYRAGASFGTKEFLCEGGMRTMLQCSTKRRELDSIQEIRA